QTTGFAAGDLVVFTTNTGTNLAPGTSVPVAQYAACVAQIASPGGIAGTTITLSTAAPWGKAGQPQCDSTSIPINNSTMMYKFVAHAYRIDPTATRAALGALQQSTNGGLLGTSDSWTDLAYGFTDIQTALRMYDGDATDQDNDSDAARDWYSGAGQSS